MLRSVTLALLLTWGSWSSAWAADLKVLPPEIVLTGPRASQQLLALSVANGKVIGDLTDKAKFTSSNLAVASVDETGAVRAAGDGEAIITASLDGEQVTAQVRVAKAKDPSAPSFRNEIIPLLIAAMRRPEDLFLAEDRSDWDNWCEFFSRTREADGRRKGIVEIVL